MSDSLNLADREHLDRTATAEQRADGRKLRALLWLNGLACCGLIGLLFLIGPSRQRPNSEQTGNDDAGPEIRQPLATATDLVTDVDDDGKPNVLKIPAQWSSEGVADFEFTERSGRTIRKADLLGRPWVAGFIFTNCAGPCYKVTSAMRQLQEEFAKDTELRLVTFTVDPERDTPQVLRKYAQTFGADEKKWLFLTGDRDKLYNVIEKSFLMPVAEEEGERRQPGYEFIHTTNLLLVDEHGVVQGKWVSVDEAVFSQMRRELRKRLRKDHGIENSSEPAGKESP